MTDATLDLRHRTHELPASLARGVHVIITCRGQKAGVLSPYTEEEYAPAAGLRVCDHPYLGSAAQTTQSVEVEMDSLRRGRFDDLRL